MLIMLLMLMLMMMLMMMMLLTSALPIIETQKSETVGLLTRQQGMRVGLRPS